MARNQFAGAAVPTTAVGAVAVGDTTITMTSSTGWPDGSIGPFVATLNLGKADEEKILVGSRSGNVLQSITRGYDGTVAATHTSATIDHTLAATQIDQVNAHTFDTTRDDHTQYYNQSRHDAHSHSGLPGIPTTPASVGVAQVGTGTATTFNHSDHTHTKRQSYTYAVPGSILAITEPMFEVGLATGETKTLVKVVTILQAGTCTVQLQKNGTNLGSAISVTTTRLATTFAQALADGDELTIVISSPSGTASGLTVTLQVDDAS